MLKHRLIFGTLMLAGLVLVVYFDDHLDQVNLTGSFWQALFLGRAYLPAGLLLFLLFLGLIPLVAREMCAIFRAKGVDADVWLISLAGMTGCALMYALPYHLGSQRAMAVVCTVIVLMLLAALVHHSWSGRTQGAVAVAGATMLALTYMGLLPGFLIAIRRWHSAWVVAAVILITKSCDIGAYFTGRAIGRHKLIVWLSPGKTWEGLIGGVIVSVLVAVGLANLSNSLGISGYYDKVEDGRHFVSQSYHLGLAAAAGVLMALAGQFGDLVASLFKRDAGIKDSGRSVPGFGGLLDVFDSPAVVAPLAYWLLAWMASAP